MSKQSFDFKLDANPKFLMALAGAIRNCGQTNPRAAVVSTLDFALALAFQHPEYARWLYEGLVDLRTKQPTMVETEQLVETFVREFSAVAE